MDWIFTGFEPWGTVTYNPSWDVAKACAEEIGGQAILLPVEFEVAKEIDRFVDPDAANVIHFGVAVTRDKICVERYAHNLDNQNRRLEDEGPVARETSRDVRALATLIDGVESRDAGCFVCNATYYTSLARNLERLFIHIPPVDASNAPAMGIRIASGLRDLQETK